MHKTYKSKKDTGGALDPREVLFSLDDKSSAFEAFYIQNIKQTKRELSCISSSKQQKSAANRVRKRKFVKRIVKEVEIPIEESMTKSTYLTPDKSIHVNRGQDLFDQLLNSSSSHVNPSNTDKNDVFDNLISKGETKTTSGKRNRAYTKKYNYSSSDTTDSDKENSNNESSHQNGSNIEQHELIIEKVSEKYSPKHQDESINQIVNNLSLINNIIKCRTPKNHKNISYIHKNRLTKNILSPSVQNSPLCSTPFKEKYRSKSIYNFSPITIRKLSKTADISNIISEDKFDESVVCLVSEDLPVSENDRLDNPSPVLNCNRRKNTSNTSQIKQSPAYTLNETNKTREETEYLVLKDNIVKDSFIQYSSEYTPFPGFSNKTVYRTNEDAQLVSDNSSPRKSLVLPTHKFSQNKNKSKDKTTPEPEVSRSWTKVEKSEELNEIFEDNLSHDSTCHIIQLSTEQEPFLGFCESYIAHNQSQNLNEIDNNSIEINDKSGDEVTVLEHSSEDQFDSVKTDEIKEGNSYFDQSDKEGSLYDTCSSLNSDGDLQQDQEPVVLLERLNNSVFNQYYNKNVYADTSSSENISNCEDVSFDDESHGSDIEAENCSTVDENTLIDISQEIQDKNSLKMSIVGSDSEIEERCISFVTTRKRNNLTNESVYMTVNDRLANESLFRVGEYNRSNTSSDFDQSLETTVVESSTDKPKDTCETSKSSDLTETLLDAESEDSIESVRTTALVKNEKHERCHLNKGNIEKNRLENFDMKPSIVLQPGKKWERSLSIYKRLSMMSGLDNSILESENVFKKGRKYRESVISTMELQDHQGPLHDASYTSCRRSFVSKPQRATIKIIKTSENSICLHPKEEHADLSHLAGFLHEDCDDTVVELSKLSIAGLPDLEVTLVEKPLESSDRLTSARDYVLRRCNQTEPLLFDECYPETVLKNCHKIGEGVYGEVFLWRARDGQARVMKVVPIAGTTKVNGEHQKDFHEIISEVVIAMELSALRAPIADIEKHLDEGRGIESLDLHTIQNATDCFNEVLAVRCVVGNYPSRLLDLWDLYDECKGSENDNPAVLPSDQQYIVLELANAGQDLESYQFNNAEQAYALFYQVAFALAVGEEAFQFEHRDLHWGNVLIAPTDQKFATFVVRGRLRRVPRRGVAATIIDYSLSRVSLPLAGGERAALYNDLAADESLFDALGDYQFDVYRCMRDKLGNDWKVFEPYTNILWLHYIVDKMITALRYKRVNTKVHKHFIGKLKGIKNRILDYGSTVQFVLTDDNDF